MTQLTEVTSRPAHALDENLKLPHWATLAITVDQFRGELDQGAGGLNFPNMAIFKFGLENGQSLLVKFKEERPGLVTIVSRVPDPEKANDQEKKDCWFSLEENQVVTFDGLRQVLHALAEKQPLDVSFHLRYETNGSFGPTC